MGSMNTISTFSRICEKPWLALIIGLIFIAGCGVGLTKIVKNTSTDAFIPDDHPSILARDKANDLFGLKDPIVIAIVNESEGAFAPQTLNTLSRLHMQISDLDNVRSDRVKSISSESFIDGDGISLIVEPFYEEAIKSSSQAEEIKNKVQKMPLLEGTLVSYDHKALLLLAELDDQKQAEQAYQSVLEVTQGFNDANIVVHVAGQGAVGGYLSKYIDADSRKLQPVVVAVILLLLFLAFMQLKGLIGPLMVIIASAIGSIGIMAYSGVNYYAITSALPVVIVAIAVADSIHVLTAYYELRAKDSESSTKTLVIEAMEDMWLPITLTTFTTLAGFFGLAYASIMPPTRFFGTFAALGVFIAWVFTMLVLPNLIILLNMKGSRVFKNTSSGVVNIIGNSLSNVALFATRHAWPSALVLSAITAFCIYAALDIKVDRAQIENFKDDEPIRIAHQEINDRFAGTAYLDIIVESKHADGLLEDGVLRKVSDLQSFLENLKHVTKTVAITDYLTELHYGLLPEENNGTEVRKFPNSGDDLAQYLLLYESSGDPQDFADEIDNQYQHLLIRAYVNSDYFSEDRPIVEAVQSYLSKQFTGDVTATLSGRVNLDYHWMTQLGNSHFKSIAISLVLVALMSAFLFRSVFDGVISLLPVMFSILCVYAVMGIKEVFLEPATSMFAAIAIGVGVDFSIHFIERLKLAMKQQNCGVVAAVEEKFPSATRACFFNAAALGFGFATLFISELPTLQRFGIMITIACMASFFSALIIVPVAYKIKESITMSSNKTSSTLATLLLTFILLTPPEHANAESSSDVKDGYWVATQLWQRDDGINVSRKLVMEMIDKNGKIRSREADVYRTRDEELRKTLIRFTKPRAIKKTAFLTFDYHQDQNEDQQWLYLPAIKKERRIPASDRGDAFLGSDFSYEDVKSELKFPLQDYHFSLISTKQEGKSTRYEVRGVPISESLMKDLGFGALLLSVSDESWIPNEVLFYDVKGTHFKTVTVTEQKQIDGIWTPLVIESVNLRTNHQTRFSYDDVAYPDSLQTGLFNVRRLGK